ncbi:hypothetical protein GQ457_12G029320 [Hibiscus cannabinus]
MIQETKKEVMSQDEIGRLWHDDVFNFEVGASLGKSGGLLMIWDNNKFCLEQRVINNSPLSALLEWFPPEAGVVKFNVDGACNSTAARCGGVLRNNLGDVKALFYGPMDYQGADFAELMAVRTALAIFFEANWTDKDYLIVESDSKVVIHSFHTSKAFTMRYEGRGENGNRTVTLFVGNLSPMMHWSGLRQAFGFHGDVVDSFVANKRDRNGRRFGFVRFSHRWDATRAIERLHGFNLYGSPISVSFAKYESKSSYWRKVRPSGYRNQGYNFEQGEPSGNKGGEISKKQFESNNLENAEQKRENSSIELKSLDMSSMLNEGKHWILGLWGNYSEKDGGKWFLLSIEDEDLYLMLEDVNWSHLREIFEGAMPWSENLKHIDRTIWLEVSGIPLHCWNHVTLRRLAELWGSFEDVGENFNMKKDCEKVTILISTGFVKEIEEQVEIEVGDIRYLQNIVYFPTVRVKEIGLSDNSSSVLRVSPKENGEETHKPLNDVTSSDSSSFSSRRRSPEKESENTNSLGDDSLIALSLGNKEIKGGCTTDVVEKEERWADVAKKRLNDEDDEVGGVEVELGENIGPVSGIQDNVSDRALGDLRCMGFQLRESNSEYIEPSNNNAKSSWELVVDKLNEKIDNRGLPQNRQSFVKVVTLEEGVEARAFPELEKKKLKEK